MVTTRSKTGSLPVAAKVEPPASDVTSKPTRRVQVARPTVRQDSKLLQLPVEILQEILSQADLIDLLNWSLCCRDLNDWLTSKRSQAIWQEATESTALSGHRRMYSYRGYHSRYGGTSPIKLPPRPERMPHFSYARLLFSEGCVACGRDIAVRCVFTCSGLEKMCERCKKSTLVSRKHLKEIWASEDLPKAFWNAIPVGIAGVHRHWRTGAGLPTPNKPAYDLDASEAFLADYQKFEALNGFNSAAVDTFIDAARDQQRDLRDFLSAFSNWPQIRKDALQVRAEEIDKYWQKLQPFIETSNRTNIIKRSMDENPRLEENDVATAIDSLEVLLKLDRPLSGTEWADMRPKILKEAEKVSSAREKFTSIFNPECIAFRDALKPYWREYTASFKQSSKEPDNIVLPTLYEFSMLPALAPLRVNSLSPAATVKRYFDDTRETINHIRKDIDADLLNYSEGILVQLASKLGGRRSKPGDAACRLTHPNAVFLCESCGQSFQGLKVLQSYHSCPTKHNLVSLRYAGIGEYYRSEAFTAAYAEELDIHERAYLRDTAMARLPIRTLSDIRIDKEMSSGVSRILNVLPSYDIVISEPITIDKLNTATSNLTFVCEVCERFGEHGRYKGAPAMLEHFKRSNNRSYDGYYVYYRMRGEDGSLLTHARISIEGKPSNKRNAGKVVKYTEVEDE